MKIRVPIAGYDIPKSMTFAHTTRLADSWCPRPERIYRPPMTVGPEQLVIEVSDGATDRPGVKRRTRDPLRLVRRLQTVDMSGKYVFDTRGQVDTNMGHYVVCEAAQALLARRRLSDELGEEIEVHVILRHNPSRMALQIFEALEIPVVTTEARVLGRIVKVSGNEPSTFVDGEFFKQSNPYMMALMPEVYDDFRPRLGRGQSETPEKIFISRKHSRTIENEPEISDLLASHGFRKYYFENDELPVDEQWRIIGGAREIVAIHGAALTSLIFNANGLARPRGDLSGLRVIELFGAGYFQDFNELLAAVMNAHWCGVRGRITPKIIKDLDERGRGRAHQASSFRIDPKSLEMALTYSAAACHPASDTRIRMGAMN